MPEFRTGTNQKGGAQASAPLVLRRLAPITLERQPHGGALQRQGPKPGAGRIPGHTQEFREACREQLYKKRSVLIRIITEFENCLRAREKARKRIEAGEEKVKMPGLTITAGEALKAVETLYEMSGMKVIKHAETDPDGESRDTFDERAVEALLDSRGRRN